MATTRLAYHDAVRTLETFTDGGMDNEVAVIRLLVGIVTLLAEQVDTLEATTAILEAIRDNQPGKP